MTKTLIDPEELLDETLTESQWQRVAAQLLVPESIDDEDEPKRKRGVTDNERQAEG